MRIAVLILVFLSFSFAKQVEIKADKFVADEGKQQGRFIGNVHISKGKDTLSSDKLTIYFDKQKKPAKYICEGHVKMRVDLKSRDYKAKAKRLTYFVAKDLYVLEGQAVLEDVKDKKTIKGSKIIVDQKQGKYEVKSHKNEPVKFIFQIDDEKKWLKQ